MMPPTPTRLVINNRAAGYAATWVRNNRPDLWAEFTKRALAAGPQRPRTPGRPRKVAK